MLIFFNIKNSSNEIYFSNSFLFHIICYINIMYYLLFNFKVLNEYVYIFASKDFFLKHTFNIKIFLKKDCSGTNLKITK